MVFTAKIGYYLLAVQVAVELSVSCLFLWKSIQVLCVPKCVCAGWWGSRPPDTARGETQQWNMSVLDGTKRSFKVVIMAR